MVEYIPKLVVREGGFEIWAMPDGTFHLIVPSMGTVVCESECRARSLMVQTQGHVVIHGSVNGKEVRIGTIRVGTGNKNQNKIGGSI